jgi:hypothetical protein
MNYAIYCWMLSIPNGRPSDARTSITVQIPIAQFETLPQLLRNPAEVTLLTAVWFLMNLYSTTD